ncbi:AMP-binding protein [Verrucosispora sp. TAA-831]|uniref:AMP-binding protein n=1 Tax=Verrucosispora sp. TAA-831 TaxID=3422227 RepID=UPI003D6DD286
MTINVPVPEPASRIDPDPLAAEVPTAVRVRPAGPPASLRRAYWVRGPLDIHALRTAWALVLDRHAALRRPPADPDSLVRLDVRHIAPRHHRIVLDAHPTVADPRSMSILAADLSTAYAEVVRGTPVHAVAAPSVRRPDAAVSAPDGEVDFDWGEELGRPLRDLAAREGTDTGTALLAGYHLVLARHGGDQAAPVAVADDLRRPGQERLVGPMTTLLPLDGRPDDADTFRTYLRRMARRRHTARQSRSSPVRWLSDATAPDHGDGPRASVLAVADPPAPLRLAGATVRALPSPLRALPVDLLLTVSSGVAGLTGTLASPTDRIGRRWIEGLLGQLRTLLTAALHDPDQPLSDLPLEDAVDQAATLRDADATLTPTPEPVTELIRRCRDRYPDALAVRSEAGNLTYAELLAGASESAARLTARVPVAGRAVALRLPMGPTLVQAGLAVLLAGGHVTWLDPGDAGDPVRTLLADLRPAALLVGVETAGDPLAEWFRTAQGGPVLTADETTHLSGPPPPAPEPASTAYVAFTSGSTGRPKGVPQTHAALAQFAIWLAHTAQLGPGSRVAQWAVVTHDPALCEVVAALTSGATVVAVPPRVRVHPERFLRWMDHEGITMLQTVPSFARELMAAIDRGAEVPARLAHLFLIGESLAVTLANRLRRALTGVRLWNLYGPTETIAASVYEIVAPLRGRRVPIGRPIPGRQVLVVDEADRLCPAGVPGEIVVRSRHAASGYLPVGTDDTPFRPLPGLPPPQDPAIRCYRTGDLGRRRFDGELEYLGRRDHQVKLAGRRVELAGLEAGLAEHPLVADCAVSPVTDPDGLVSRLVVFVVPRPPASPPVVTRELRVLLRRRHGPVSRRTSFVPLDRIPRNPAGKVDRARLPDPRTADHPRRMEDEHG